MQRCVNNFADIAKRIVDTRHVFTLAVKLDLVVWSGISLLNDLSLHAALLFQSCLFVSFL